MTVNEALTQIDRDHKNTVPRETKLRWLNLCEANIQIDIMLLYCAVRQYKSTDGNKTLIAPLPFDEIYLAYLDARLYEHYQEYALYETAKAKYDKLQADFAGWYAEYWRPLYGGRMPFPEDDDDDNT